MAVRPINAINLKKYIQGLDVSLPYDEQDKEDIIKQVCCIIDNWPTLTPPNEPLTCDGCYWQTHGSFGQCFGCFREKTDNYRRLPEKEEDT